MLTVAFLGELGIRFISVSNHRKKTFESNVGKCFERIRNIYFLLKLTKSMWRDCKYV